MLIDGQFMANKPVMCHCQSYMFAFSSEGLAARMTSIICRQTKSVCPQTNPEIDIAIYLAWLGVSESYQQPTFNQQGIIQLINVDEMFINNSSNSSDNMLPIIHISYSTYNSSFHHSSINNITVHQQYILRFSLASLLRAFQNWQWLSFWAHKGYRHRFTINRRPCGLIWLRVLYPPYWTK